MFIQVPGSRGMQAGTHVPEQGAPVPRTNFGTAEELWDSTPGTGLCEQLCIDQVLPGLWTAAGC